METSHRTYADFLRNAFPWTQRIEWFGRGGIIVLDDDRRAEIDPASLSNQGSETYGVLVKIVSKKSGQITSRSFRYDDFLTDRADTRTDWTPGPQRVFHVKEHLGFDWYIAVPARPKDFSNAVEHFINLYR